MLIPRESVNFGAGLPAKISDWRSHLGNAEQSFLTDNQLSVFVNRKQPGCDQTQFYPLPFPYQFKDNQWDFHELTNHNCLRSVGPRLEFEPETIEYGFMPHRTEKVMRSRDAAISERCAVSGNKILFDWEIDGLETLQMSFSLPYFSGTFRLTPNGFVISVKGEVFAAISILGAQFIDVNVDEDPVLIDCTMEIEDRQNMYLALVYDYDEESAVESATEAVFNPDGVFDAAEQTWDDYFTKIVPYFSCSTKEIEKLYYYLAYTTRANLFDIPYEPFTHPYTCPWKPGALWQWSWSTPMNSVSERWLNDKRIGAGGTLLVADNGGGLNIGSYLHPLKKVTGFRWNIDHARVLREYREQLPAEYDMLALTTFPHTTPSGLLGAWEFYRSSGDKGFLRQLFALMIEAESGFSRSELENGLCTCVYLDEFDLSLRLKPFVEAFSKDDYEMVFKMDTPFIAVDYNCYLYELRNRIIQAASILMDDSLDIEALRTKNAKLKSAINEYLWDELQGFYFDADPRNMKQSYVKSIAGFSALYAGIASRVQAERLLEHLTNPDEFGTPYPFPSVSMDTPDVDPGLLTYGGDSLVTSCVWFTIEGLARYGYRDLAASSVLKAIEMVNRDGPSSSYSYNSLTADCNQEKHTLASQCTIIIDLICKYIIGIHPSDGETLKADPMALRASGIKEFTFGPYNYCGKDIVVQWNEGQGYILEMSSERV